MAASSIFYNVILTTPKEVESFVNALETSIANPYPTPRMSLSEIMADKDEIRRLHELRVQNRNGN